MEDEDITSIAEFMGWSEEECKHILLGLDAIGFEVMRKK